MDKYNIKKRFINYHRPIFEAFLNPVSLLPFLTCLESEVHHKIRSCPDHLTNQVNLLLSALENSEDPYILQKFLDAINSAEDQVWLYPVFNENLSCEELEKFLKFFEDIKAIKKLWQLLQPQLKNINVEDCIHVLSVKFTREEKENLLQKFGNYGNCYTLWWMIDVLMRKGKGWIQEFKDHVEECNYLTTDGQMTVAELIKTYFNFECDSSKKSDFWSENPSNEIKDLNTSSENCTLNISQSYVEENKTTNDLSEPPSVCLSNDDFDQSNKKIYLKTTEEKSKKELRSYQKELVCFAEKGKNVIICAPPGAGKTIVAAHIAKNYLETFGNLNKSVLFFTPGSALALQQTERLKDLLNDFSVDSCYGNCEDSDLMLHNADVIVLTPQILLNALQNQAKENPIKSIGQYGLLIFDECHHCMKGHPYNGVMREYFNLKRKLLDSPEKLPQVVGLTATMGIGKKFNEANDQIVRLCSNLDAVDGIVTVQDPDNIEELYQHIPFPDEDTYQLERRTNDVFFVELVKSIDKFLLHLKTCGEFDPPRYSSSNDQLEPMKQWCVNTRRKIAEHATNGRDSISCIEYIEVVVNAQEIYLKCRAVDAINILEEFKQHKVPEKFNEIEILLYLEFEESLEKLQQLSKARECRNPNLTLIEKLLLKKFEEKPDSTAMLMVEKRIYTKTLKEWMNESKRLKFLKAEVFTGVGSNTDSAGTGLSHSQQQAVMKSFREGEHKLLVCTPDAAGEGIDVAGCNLVINYDYMKSDTAMVQIRGRIRKIGGEVFQLSSPKVAQRDRLNAQKTELMQEAILNVQKFMKQDTSGYRKQLSTMQEEMRRLFENELKEKLTKRQTSDKEFLLQCRKCQMDVCSSLDIRVVDGGQHTNATKEFREKYATKEHPRKRAMGVEWDKKTKIRCQNCAHDWGIEAMWKESITLPLIKMEGLRIVDLDTQNFYAPRKWKDVPFTPITANLTDIVNDTQSSSFSL